MEKIKVIIIVLLLTTVWENVSEGSPLRSHFVRDFSNIAVTDDELAKVKLQGTRQEYRTPSIPLTTLTPIEEAPDPPDSPDSPDSVYQKTDQSKQFKPQEFTNDQGKAIPRDSWLIPARPSSHVDSKRPNDHSYTDNDSQDTPKRKEHLESVSIGPGQSFLGKEYLPANTDPGPDAGIPEDAAIDTALQSKTNQNQVDSHGIRDELPSINRVQRKLRSLLEKHKPNEELQSSPSELHRKKDAFDINREEIHSDKDNDKEQSSRSEEESFTNENPEVFTPEGQFTSKGTSSLPEVKTGVRPERTRPLNIRWPVAHPLTKRDDNTRYKVKRKKKAEDPAKSSSPIIVAGIAAGILVLFCIVTSVFQLCKKCRKKPRDLDDPELGAAADRGETATSKKSFFKRKGAMRKKKGNDKSAAKSKDHHAGSTEKADNNTTGENTTHYNTQQSTQPGEVCLVDETVGSDAFSGCQSPMSEPSSCTPNETPASSPMNGFSGISLQSEPPDLWNYSQSGQNDTLPSASTSAPTSDDNETANETTSPYLSAPESPVACDMQEASTSTAAESTALSKDSGGSVKCTNETNTSNSSTESCKTPVAPLNEVIITIEDEVETKLVLVPSSECSSAELLSSGTGSAAKLALDVNGSTLERDNEDNSLLGSEYESSSGELIYSTEPHAMKIDSTADNDDSFVVSPPSVPPLPPPQPTPPKASTELKRGKAIGGRKAKNTRLIIRRLTSKDHSSGFLDHLKVAWSQILTEKDEFVDKSKEKRRVIKVQTEQTRTSLTESIGLGKSIIMNEKLDKKRQKRCAVKRRVIRKALSVPSDSTTKSHSPLSEEIAFAKSVILPGITHQKANRRNKEMSKVIGKMVNELHDPGFEDRIRIAASTINADEETRDLNAKGLHMRRVIKMDAILMKKRGRKSTFKSDIMFARSVIFGPPASDHVKHPQMSCGCYYCKKHWAKTGGPPCFIPPKAFAIAKGILLIDGMLYFTSTKRKLPICDSVQVAPVGAKTGFSAHSNPSTSSARGTVNF